MQSNTDILIVEDDIVAASLLKKTLIDLGHNVIGVEVEGERAIAMATEKKPELMMVDFQLEGQLNGADVTRGVLETHNTAIIYVTSKSDRQTLKIIAETNPHGYILKPFNRQEIGMVIDTVLKKFREETELNTKNQELGMAVEMTNDELKKSLVELEKEIELRKIAEQQLTEALQREKEFSNIKSRLAQSISHEFKMPLTSILSSTEILKLKFEESDDESLDKHLGRISEGTLLLKKILSNILFLEKSGVEGTGNSPSSIEVKGFVEDIIEDVKREVKKCPEIELHTYDTPVSVKVYAELLKQVVGNLTSNAAKYSSGKGPVVINLFGKKDQLLFEFIDNGIGIPDEDQPHLFEYFFRAKNVKKIEGSGVGLAITKNFAGLLGADISFESKENMGTKFNLKLPLINN